jgi:shikimate kinase
MDSHTPENVVLVGFMGTGKSTIGRLAAKALHFDFVDTDQLIVDRTHLPITDLFAQHGEDYFRDQETAVIRSLIAVNRCIISTGGGAVIRPENRDMLRRSGFVVRLTASEDILMERVSRNSKRPLLQSENPRETLHKLLAAREEAYEHSANWTLDTSHMSVSEAVDALTRSVENHFQWTRSPSNNG